MMMKRAVSFVLFGLGSAALFGCPIYPADRDHRLCIDDDCYACPDPYYSSACTPLSCDGDRDCPSDHTCTSDHRCVYTSGAPAGSSSGGVTGCAHPAQCPPETTCGADNQCHRGDCSTTGCPSGYVCRLDSGSGGKPACMPIGADGGGGSSSTCRSDKDCPSPTGSRCLTGSCVAPQDQCADATQCPGKNAQCVDGACTPSCNANTPCPTGYSCDAAKGVCTGNATPCTSGAQCAAGKTCVQEHCVEPCGAGGTCGAGLKCVDGGCTPDQRPVFTCAIDGAQDSCQPGSICLRHSCYIGCSADAGEGACKSADNFNQCKPVTTSSGTYDVCGSTSNLGTECDPTQNKACTSGLICIDGYCK
jgi:hypothetical protein